MAWPDRSAERKALRAAGIPWQSADYARSQMLILGLNLRWGCSGGRGGVASFHNTGRIYTFFGSRTRGSMAGRSVIRWESRARGAGVRRRMALRARMFHGMFHVEQAERAGWIQRQYAGDPRVRAGGRRGMGLTSGRAGGWRVAFWGERTFDEHALRAKDRPLRRFPGSGNGAGG